jgi:hypothetical protein
MKRSAAFISVKKVKFLLRLLHVKSTLLFLNQNWAYGTYNTKCYFAG